MNEVYIVLSQRYDSCTVECVFSTKEKAMSFLKEFEGIGLYEDRHTWIHSCKVE